MSSIHLSPRTIKTGSRRLLLRFHVVIFIVAAAGGASLMILAMYNTVQLATDVNEQPSISTSSFDQETIERLNDLPLDTQRSDALVFPSGQRVDPFVE
jgi:hypothetical protein